ncbi:undecaprenyl-diphosphate phosphatase [Chitinivibrio alkaliphilus]|uniref:Undecaprenyl-diphosphatase n=1 Tax=Chitinivibrio alkaliphilus ACht1 TaxID=1313304 RepID=U7DBK7_9BACT|nr:undecaprenyl-diphosphate phosphatase [Chitinivibrio alkaliphilus]ERP31815.1 undecaprenyl pyrophosphate phosphatase [Chitinivibrio alkaliphilus ACht1]
MYEAFNMIIIAIIQGITEFIPVSSSGHIVLAQHFTGMSVDAESDFAVNILLHMGTFVAVIYIYRMTIMELFKNLVSKDAQEQRESFLYLWYIVLASIPVGIVGILFADDFEAAFGNPFFVSLMLFITAAILFASRFGSVKDAGIITAKTALLIGLAQVFALFPGISRSGTTITAAILLGITREEAGRFSFMIFLPAIGGAALLKLPNITQTDYSFALLTIAFFTSLVVGIFALKVLLKFVNKGKLYIFSPYCLVVAILSLISLQFL